MATKVTQLNRKDLAREILEPHQMAPFASPSGKQAVFECSIKGKVSICLLELKTGRFRSVTAGFAPSWTADGDVVFLAGDRDKAAISRIRNGKVEELCPPAEKMQRLRTSGERFVFVKDRKVYAATAGCSEARELGPTDEYSSLDLSPDGRFVVTHSGPGRLRVVDVESGSSPLEVEGRSPTWLSAETLIFGRHPGGDRKNGTALFSVSLSAPEPAQMVEATPPCLVYVRAVAAGVALVHREGCKDPKAWTAAVLHDAGP